MLLSDSSHKLQEFHCDSSATLKAEGNNEVSQLDGLIYLTMLYKARFYFRATSSEKILIKILQRQGRTPFILVPFN
jgi:hypothetical protein